MMVFLYLIKKLTKTLDELTERFAGSSIENSTIEGSWVETIGERKLYYKDKNRLLWIICDDTKENRVFFTKYKRKLILRFRQRSILMLITNDVSII
jgi:hypothetical protein